MSQYKPDRSEYEGFENQLSKESSTDNLQSGLKIFLAMLFVVPAIGAFAFVVMYILCQYRVTGELICGTPLLFALAGFSVFQAYQGLVKRELTLPVRRGATARYLHRGEKAEPRIRGSAAVAVGVAWVILALLFTITAIRLLIAPLLSQ